MEETRETKRPTAKLSEIDHQKTQEEVAELKARLKELEEKTKKEWLLGLSIQELNKTLCPRCPNASEPRLGMDRRIRERNGQWCRECRREYQNARNHQKKGVKPVGSTKLIDFVGKYRALIAIWYKAGSTDDANTHLLPGLNQAEDQLGWPRTELPRDIVKIDEETTELQTYLKKQ